MTNVFFINFKNYPQAFEGFPKIYQDLEKTALRYPKVTTIFAPPPLIAAKVAETIKLPLWAQHLDPLPLGRGTGFLPLAAGKYLGIAGTFLNHSEHPLSTQELKRAVEMAKGANLATLIFAATPEKIREVRDLNPDCIAYEPPELIGAGVEKGISVATAKPSVIPKAVEASGPIPLLVGAGIFQPSDIEISMKLGAAGGLVASAIVTADNPTRVLDDLLSAY